MLVTTYVLLPSVVLGAVAWQPVARTLAAGDEVVVASTDGCTAPEDLLAAYVGAVPAGADEVVLVPHSNAGLYAPAVAARVGAAAVVYVDAAMAPSTGPAPLAPPALLGVLTRLADDGGTLPPWTEWWADLAGLFPDDASRARVEAVQPRLPLAYFRSSVEAPAAWETAPSGYLAFGDGYAEEYTRAGALGWPRRRLDAGHLHVLHDPAGCAEAIRSLAALALRQARP